MIFDLIRGLVKIMRVFVAVPISNELQGKILEWEKFFPDLSVRWLLGKNLHITLVPPWEENNVEGVKNLLEKVENPAPFEAEFNDVSFGPNPKSPRLIWASGNAPREMVNLKNNVEKVLEINPENRPYKLHLTLARFKLEDFRNFSIKNLNEKVLWKERVDSFVLMESRLSRAGADYETIFKKKFYDH